MRASTFVASLLAGTALLSGCSWQYNREVEATSNAGMAAIKDYQQKPLGSAIGVSDGLWLSGRKISADVEHRLPDVLSKGAVDFASGGPLTVTAMAARIQSIFGVPILVTGTAPTKAGATVAPAGHLPTLPPPPGGSGFGAASAVTAAPMNAEIPTATIQGYHGSLSGLLSVVAGSYDYAWSWVDGHVEMSPTVARTYFLAANMAQRYSLTTGISNRSDSGSGSSGGGSSSGGSNASSGASSTATSMLVDLHPWPDVINQITALVGSRGTVASNASIHQVMVVAPPSVQREVDALVQGINASTLRQVSLRLDVITVDMSDAENLGVNMNTVFQSLSKKYGLTLTGPTNTATTGMGGLAGTVASGPLAGTSITPQNLMTYTNTRLVYTNLKTVMNDDVGHVQEVKITPYIASEQQTVASAVTAATVTATQGQVNTGIDMWMQPTIMGGDALVLGYGVQISILVSNAQVALGSTGFVQQPVVQTFAASGRQNVQVGHSIMVQGYAQAASTGTSSGMGFADNILTGGDNGGNRDRIYVICVITPVETSGGKSPDHSTMEPAAFDQAGDQTASH